MAVFRMFVAAALLAAAAGQADTQKIQNSNIDDVMPPGFQTHTMTFSLHMHCRATTPDNCFTGTLARPGPFNRDGFVTRLIAAYNQAAQQVRASYGDIPASEVAAASFSLTASHIRFDRVVEQTDPFNSQLVIQSVGTDNFYGTDPDVYWNAYLRVTLVDVPEDVSAVFRSEVAGRLMDQYATIADVIPGSFWISSDPNFIGDRLEPVTGLGNKDQKMLIPLIMGVVAMLGIPALISFGLVTYAKSQNEYAAQLQKKEEEIRFMQTDSATKQAAINVFHETEEARQEQHDREMELQELRDKEDLEDKDVDWESKRLASQPYGQ